MAKVTFRPLIFNVNAPEAIVTREGRMAARNVLRGKSLEDQLRIGRLLKRGHDIACRQAGLPNTTSGAAGRGYNEAMSRWLQSEPDLAALGRDLRGDALYLIIHWRITEHIIAELDDYQRQRMAANGLRKLVEAVFNPKRAKLKGQSPYERLVAMFGGIGLLGTETEGVVISDLRVFGDWLRFIGYQLPDKYVAPPAEGEAPPPAENATVGLEPDEGEGEGEPTAK
jgi:hypothetical protein